jgi:hypothetical protein
MQGCTPFQSNSFALRIGQSLRDTNFLIRFLYSLNRNLNFLGFSRNRGLNNCFHFASQNVGSVTRCEERWGIPLKGRCGVRRANSGFRLTVGCSYRGKKCRT